MSKNAIATLQQSYVEAVRDAEIDQPEIMLFLLKKLQDPDYSIRSDRWYEDNLAAVYSALPNIFNDEPSEIQIAATEYLLDTTCDRSDRTSDTFSLDFPLSWFHLFYAMYQCGMIGSVVWGVVARRIYQFREAPWPKIGGQRFALNCIKDGNPLGLMSEDERGKLASLPDNIEIYRGGCADDGSREAARREMAQGMSWALDYDLACSYMRVRSSQRRFDLTAGWPVLVTATVPKDVVLAYCSYETIDRCELIVDFEMIPLSGVMFLDFPLMQDLAA